MNSETSHREGGERGTGVAPVLQNRKPVHRKVEDEEEGGANERKGGERGGGWIGVARVASTVLRTCSRTASSSGV